MNENDEKMPIPAPSMDPQRQREIEAETSTADKPVRVAIAHHPRGIGLSLALASALAAGASVLPTIQPTLEERRRSRRGMTGREASIRRAEYEAMRAEAHTKRMAQNREIADWNAQIEAKKQAKKARKS